jgi:hypothetical protein
VTHVTESSPGSNAGTPPGHLWQGLPPPPDNPAGMVPGHPVPGHSLPPVPNHPAQPGVRPFRARAEEGSGGDSAATEAGTPQPDAGSGPVPPHHGIPAEAVWTFHPDQVVEEPEPEPENGPALNADDGRTRARTGLAPRLGAVAVVLALVIAASAVSHIGPFHASAGAVPNVSSPEVAPTDVRGTWVALVGYAQSLYTETLDITTENRATGAFLATITSPVGVQTMTGTVTGTTMSFAVSFGTGTERGGATVSSTSAKLEIKGTFANRDGGLGTIVATRPTP